MTKLEALSLTKNRKSGDRLSSISSPNFRWERKELASMNSGFRAVIAIAISCLICICADHRQAFAQTTGSLSGCITDLQGASVAGAKLVIVSLEDDPAVSLNAVSESNAGIWRSS
jgi:hypothetical protein